MHTGILNIYKEKGYTSFDVVARLRGICQQKKIGHTGTLDPDAEGVLLVCLGKATKICDMLTDSRKEYVAVMRLGVQTDTQDMTGQVLARGDLSDITEDDIRQTVRSFLGEGMQIPPMYSALKVNGQKLCDLARRGITVERKPRPVFFEQIRIESIRLPEVRIRVRCSKGTYIRTLCHDIGQKLGCGAAMQSLLRTEVAGFRVSESRKLDEVEEARDAGKLPDLIIPVETVFRDLPQLFTVQGEEIHLLNGAKMPAEAFSSIPPAGKRGWYRACMPDGRFVAVYQQDEEEHIFRPVKMFGLTEKENS